MATEEEKLVLDNLGLAYDLAWKYYRKFNGIYELDELQSVAFLGLTKAANTFKVELGFGFSTYAYKCMQNEIIIYHKENKKYLDILYFSEEIDDNGKILEDILANDYDMLKSIEDNEYNKKLYYEISKLNDRHRTVMEYKLKGFTMNQIGDFLNVSQQQISKDYNNALNILRNKFKDWRDI